MQEKENVLKILEETKKAVREKDVVKLKELSNKTIHTASIAQDPDNITVAVIVYSLSKIIERKKYEYYKEWPKFYKTYISCIDKTIDAIKKDDDKSIMENLREIRGVVGELSGNLKNYIKDVFRKASINKASKIYEHGISLEQTAKLLGITMWELAGYAGQTDILESELGETEDVKSRIKIAREMFE